MLYRFTARRSACEVIIFLSVCLLKPLSVFNHAEKGFFYGQIKRPSAQPAEQHIFISNIIGSVPKRLTVKGTECLV
jgi:hypothetical protein